MVNFFNFVPQSYYFLSIVANIYNKKIMKNFIREKIREAVNMPSFDLPTKVDLTPEEIQAFKSLNWNDISVEPKENDGSHMFYIDVAFRNPELNKFASSIKLSIQMIKNTSDEYMYYHPHLFLADNLQGMGLAPKLLKAFIMDFGHLYVTKARTLNQNFTKMFQGLSTDPDFESVSDDKATLIMKKGNPDRNELIKIIRNNQSQGV